MGYMESFLELKDKDLLMLWTFLFWKLINHHRKMKKKKLIFFTTSFEMLAFYKNKPT